MQHIPNLSNLKHKVEIIVLSTVFLWNHRLLKVALQELCNQRRRNLNVDENAQSKENRD